MPSVVISGNRYRAKPEEADKHGPFGKVFLAEGDSWMDASAWNQGSLPEYLVREYNKRGVSNLVIKISTSGHTLTRIIDMLSDDFGWWLNQYEYAGILFSAGGNDFIDAAKDPAPGAGLLKDLRGSPAPQTARECVREEALAKLISYLNKNFQQIYGALRSNHRNAATPIFLNCYDTPTARNAPAIQGISGPWLYAAYTKNAVPPKLWPELTDFLFNEIKTTVEGWATGRTGVVIVPTTGLLTRAAPTSQGEDQDWVNEIHPNKAGWKKQVKAWIPKLA